MGIGDFFSSIKNKAVGALLERQMKNLPPEQKELFKKLIEENPELFKKISAEVDQMKKDGMNETYASVMVMKKYQGALAKAAKPYQTIERRVQS